MPKRQVSERSKRRRKVLRWTRRLAKWCLKRQREEGLDLLQALAAVIAWMHQVEHAYDLNPDYGEGIPLLDYYSE